MKIAVTYDNGEIFQHFGHSEQFKMYEVKDGKIITSEIVSTNGAGHGAIAQFLNNNHVDTVICGGIGGGAKNALKQINIKLYGGVSGNADEAVEALLSNNLSFNPDVKCSHHEHQHHGEAHTCGANGCGHNCHGSI